MDAVALLGHPAVVVAIVVAIVAIALVVVRRRRRARPAVPAPQPEPQQEAGYLDSSHIIEGPIVGDAERPGGPDRPRDG